MQSDEGDSGRLIVGVDEVFAPPNAYYRNVSLLSPRASRLTRAELLSHLPNALE